MEPLQFLASYIVLLICFSEKNALYLFCFVNVFILEKRISQRYKEKIDIYNLSFKKNIYILKQITINKTSGIEIKLLLYSVERNPMMIVEVETSSVTRNE